jgi:putative SOS response-associated peptidase YedK
MLGGQESLLRVEAASMKARPARSEAAEYLSFAKMPSVVLEAHGRRRLTTGPWADSLEHANQAYTFNAKAETLTNRPAYRNALLKRRCVVPAEAFYEWVGPKKERQPLNIARSDGKLLSMAGLFNLRLPKAVLS